MYVIISPNTTEYEKHTKIQDTHSALVLGVQFLPASSKYNLSPYHSTSVRFVYIRILCASSLIVLYLDTVLLKVISSRQVFD